MKLKRETSNNYYKEFDINGNIIIENQYPGDKIEYVYEKDNRLIKKKVIVDDGPNEYIYEHNYEYNNFGYRISVFKTKETYPITSFSNDPKTKTEETYEPITTTDVKIENGKVISKIITDFRTKTVKTENIYEPIEVKPSLKYDAENRIIERITEENQEQGEIIITEYHYSLIVLKDSYGGSSTHKKILALSFIGYKEEDGLPDDANFLLESIAIEIFDDEDNIINRVSQSNLYQQTSNPIKRLLNSNDKYYLDGATISIDKTFDNIEKNVELYEYEWLTKDKRLLVSITSLSIINDTINVLNKTGYGYFDE